MINPAQAAVVRRIFAWSAEGRGITRIAKQLNAEGIAPPRGGEHAGLRVPSATGRPDTMPTRNCYARTTG